MQTTADTPVTFSRRINSNIAWDQRGLSAAIQPETLTQGDYPRVDSPVINAEQRLFRI